MHDIDFGVDRITEDGLIVGRNGYAEIPVGTVFTIIAKTRLDGELSTINLGTAASVNLRLTEVWHFRRSIDAIPGGHSAGLRLDGDGIELLKHALSHKGPREFVALRIAPQSA